MRSSATSREMGLVDEICSTRPAFPDLRTDERKTVKPSALRRRDLQGTHQVTLFIDFATGAIPYDCDKAAAWKGSLTLPAMGFGSMQLRPAGEAKQTLWGV